MYKKIIGLFILFLLFSSVSFSSSTVPLDFTTWSKYHANGSEVLNVTPTEAVFKILRTNPGPKKDVRTHGYAYLISGPISIPSDWGKIIIEGTWWKDRKSQTNYEEMVFLVFAKKPAFVHRSYITNYMYISYAEWERILRFRDKGQTSDKYNKAKIPRSIPTKPTRFKVIFYSAIPRGEAGWEYWEQQSNGHWEKLYAQQYSNMFDNTSHDKLYLKIGGWCTWEYPTISYLHFKDLNMKVYTQQEIQEGLGEVVFDEETPTPTPSVCGERPKGIEDKILSMLPAPDGEIIPFPKRVHPGGGSYRGVCGTGQAGTLHPRPNIGIKVYPENNNCYYLVYYQDIIEAGTHTGCRYHDACFDICKEEVGEDFKYSEYVGPCHDGCSGIVVSVFGPPLGAGWMQRGGPYDDMILFAGKRDVLGPYYEKESPISKLKDEGVISRNTKIYNTPSFPTKSLYMIEVWTGDKWFAGTDAQISIELVDKNARSSGWINMPSAPFIVESLYDSVTSIILTGFVQKNAIDYFLHPQEFYKVYKDSGFERGNHEKYYFLWGGYIEKVDHIFLKRDNSGTGPDWYCEKIKVYREEWNSFETPEELGDIPVHSWIGTKEKRFNAK